MSLVVYPQAPPAPSPFLKTIERGQQNVILSNIGAVQTFTGTALPAGSVAFAVPPCGGNEQAMENWTIEIDSGGGTPAAVIHVLGSLDLTTWYDLGALQAAGTYGLFFSWNNPPTPGVIGTVGAKKLRGISAYCSAYGGSGGTTDSITVSVYF